MNVNSIPSGYAFKKNSPYEKIFSKKLTRLRHLFSSLKQSFDASIKILSCDNAAKDSYSLSQMKLVSLFIVMLAGIIISITVLTFEKTFHKLEASKNDKKLADSRKQLPKVHNTNNGSVPLVLYIKSWNKFQQNVTKGCWNFSENIALFIAFSDLSHLPCTLHIALNFTMLTASQ